MNEIPSGQITSYQSGQIDMLTTVWCVKMVGDEGFEPPTTCV